MSFGEIILGVIVLGLILLYIWPPYYLRGGFIIGRKRNGRFKGGCSNSCRRTKN